MFIKYNPLLKKKTYENVIRISEQPQYLKQGNYVKNNRDGLQVNPAVGTAGRQDVVLSHTPDNVTNIVNTNFIY